ncbi:PQQ-dependent sugar dehydrogenase [Paracoccus aminophilus]|uniref:Glucose sorbosone dehydrogenase n=1 Tax=Paracoccus aminophilus JCM 7686 TaxID=1367847 RepID=S5XYB0_PARAH|nr:PQQ-dependent sugar dehydrogenase [Paracoccus aminophilus]AGT10302.1 glucose sorbosone dehydrogenase [Paracoccus aminophilus JCM 7686]
MKRLAAILLALLATPAFADFNDAPPNAPDQKPAFPDQTRAPVLAPALSLKVQPLVQGLEHPWGMAFLPDGAILVTERPGRMRLIGPDNHVSAPLTGLPPVDARNQGGLLDVAVRPDFAKTRQLWWSYAEPHPDGTTNTAVATGTLSADGTAVENVRVIFHQQPAWASTLHYGSRLVFDRQGMLFVTTGERSLPEPRKLAQDLTTDLGKVIRIDPETGAPAPGNPRFSGVEARPEIWSYGHRNLQGAALDPATGALWTVEHGPRGGDELNRPEAGKNYGWPLITYGEDYSGKPIGKGQTAAPGLEQPVYYWDPVIAPSGMVFYEGAMFPEMKGDILIGGLRGEAVVRLKMSQGRVVGEQRLLEGIGRVRDVAVAPDGAIYLLTDADKGALIRVTRN